MATNVFVSVGRTFSAEQEKFVSAIESYLKGIGLNPQTVGRNYFKSQQPLRSITECMRECSGTVIIAFERIYVANGEEKRGSSQPASLSETKITTIWNQIEAAMAYTLGQPLLVIAQEGIRAEGLIDEGFDWFVKRVDLKCHLADDPEFVAILADYKARVDAAPRAKLPGSGPGQAALAPSEMTVAQLIGSLKASQLWATLAAIIGVVAGAAAVAYQIGHLRPNP